MQYLLGTDIGTSGTKTNFDGYHRKADLTGLEEYDVLTPKPLWQNSGRMCGMKLPKILSAIRLQKQQRPE